MKNRERALVLAAFEVADLAATQLSPRYGADHLDHLMVPIALRPVLPIVKVAAIASLIVSSNRRSMRSVVGAALVSYYSAAAAFHILARDHFRDVAPAIVGTALAATLV